MDYPSLSNELFENLHIKFYENPTNVVAQNMCTRHDPMDVSLSHDRIRDNHHVFTHKIEDEGKPVTDHGGCRDWIFAGLNLMRIPFIKKYDLDEFEFSQPYVFYWDKVERCYYFLNKVVELARRNEPIDGRLMSELLMRPCVSGGQWGMFVNLINKYGLMPKKNFPETDNSRSPATLDYTLWSKCREFSIVLRKMVEDSKSDTEIKAKIEEQMEVVYRIISICLGIPQKKFTWEYVDKSKEYHSIGPITPKEFYEKLVKPLYNIDDKVCLINDPRPTLRYNQVYTVDCLNNVVGGKKVIFNNQPIELLIELCVKSIKNNEPVWFRCEISQCASGGLLDLKIRDLNKLFGDDAVLHMTKAERLLYCDAFMHHAVVFTAVSLDDNDQPTKWRVEESGGTGCGEQGYYLMTNDWFKEFVYEVVIDKSIVPNEVLEVFEKDPVVLPVWDPMGAKS